MKGGCRLGEILEKDGMDLTAREHIKGAFVVV
jgi:hypothetical protein